MMSIYGYILRTYYLSAPKHMVVESLWDDRNTDDDAPWPRPRTVHLLGAQASGLV